ncbi:hypothetical protein N864_19195 [Intrasporangium chromatireducens Q5-1]|uniref:Uncharacterized protein n=1 Tax=Intrasporangium chromatireducens Q5-1 TaxID=584657 RepID=W9GIK1_9MICO|nr:PIN domain-containing protein [Intrasporangium chromatireducens]EWT03719.1 hypothetical protein N864_19195 [Intrasporangium chromatireducens Q5-1]
MSDPVIVDCGPALNFLATRQERILLHATGGYICAPETVRTEVFRKARPGSKFEAAAPTWARLEHAKRLTVLPDDLTPALEAVVQRLSNTPMIERMAVSKDLGEELVIAHAVVRAEAGADVIMLIDEIKGARAAAHEIRRLERLASQGQAVGSLALYNTHTILKACIRTTYIPDRNAMRTIYTRLRGYDDGLIDIRQTDLLSNSTWA